MITLGVSDLKRSIAFYQRLGFPRIPMDTDVAFFNLNGTWLGLFGREAPPGPESSNPPRTSSGAAIPAISPIRTASWGGRLEPRPVDRSRRRLKFAENRYRRLT
jgi:catechol 2,3-dioxygenase-like lactoylglutathione lyase family enzyme